MASFLRAATAVKSSISERSTGAWLAVALSPSRRWRCPAGKAVSEERGASGRCKACSSRVLMASSNDRTVAAPRRSA